MTHTELFHTYLRHYADKNLEAISAMLAEEVHIGVDGKIDLYVVDVVTFNAQGKVTAIRSYKGHGD